MVVNEEHRWEAPGTLELVRAFLNTGLPSAGPEDRLLNLRADPEGWAATDLTAGLRDRSSVANGTRRATRCRTSLGEPLSRGVVRSRGQERLPYLSRMCSSMASSLT